MAFRRKTVSFWARKPVNTRVSFRRSDGSTASFRAKVPRRRLVRFKSRW